LEAFSNAVLKIINSVFAAVRLTTPLDLPGETARR
jgi:hypothetical protein